MRSGNQYQTTSEPGMREAFRQVECHFHTECQQLAIRSIQTKMARLIKLQQYVAQHFETFVVQQRSCLVKEGGE